MGGISPVHARLHFDAGHRAFLANYGQAGTYLNGQLITAIDTRTPLNTGDLFRVGERSFVFHYPLLNDDAPLANTPSAVTVSTTTPTAVSTTPTAVSTTQSHLIAAQQERALTPVHVAENAPQTEDLLFSPKKTPRSGKKKQTKPIKTPSELLSPRRQSLLEFNDLPTATTASTSTATATTTTTTATTAVMAVSAKKQAVDEPQITTTPKKAKTATVLAATAQPHKPKTIYASPMLRRTLFDSVTATPPTATHPPSELNSVKKVSFGPVLSPEIIDAARPPADPVKRGTPVKMVQPVSAPRSLLKTVPNPQPPQDPLASLLKFDEASADDDHDDDAPVEEGTVVPDPEPAIPLEQQVLPEVQEVTHALPMKTPVAHYMSLVCMKELMKTPRHADPIEGKDALEALLKTPAPMIEHEAHSDLSNLTQHMMMEQERRHVDDAVAAAQQQLDVSLVCAEEMLTTPNVSSDVGLEGVGTVGLVTSGADEMVSLTTTSAKKGGEAATCHVAGEHAAVGSVVAGGGDDDDGCSAEQREEEQEVSVVDQVQVESEVEVENVVDQVEPKVEEDKVETMVVSVVVEQPMIIEEGPVIVEQEEEVSGPVALDVEEAVAVSDGQAAAAAEDDNDCAEKQVDHDVMTDSAQSEQPVESAMSVDEVQVDQVEQQEVQDDELESEQPSLPPVEEPVEQVKTRRGRPKKVVSDVAPVEAETKQRRGRRAAKKEEESASESVIEEAPKKRGRPKKVVEAVDVDVVEEQVCVVDEVKPKRGARKTHQPPQQEAAVEVQEPKPKKRGRKAVAAALVVDEPAPVVEEKPKRGGRAKKVEEPVPVIEEQPKKRGRKPAVTATVEEPADENANSSNQTRAGRRGAAKKATEEVSAAEPTVTSSKRGRAAATSTTKKRKATIAVEEEVKPVRALRTRRK